MPLIFLSVSSSYSVYSVVRFSITYLRLLLCLCGEIMRILQPVKRAPTTLHFNDCDLPLGSRYG